jgi:tetratricopeptide (TPR) repeat protein
MSNFTRRFPLLVAIGALMLFGITLSHGVTMNSLSLTAKIAGWDWTPMVGQPLLWLFTLPLRLLPAAWVPLGLNFFSAATAALTLGLLARTVQLLPWDRPWESTNRLASALPVLLACVVCGLEFSFWQEATAATGKMLNLLLLAAALWLLLEYRVRNESPWLYAATFVWGLGMAENWLLLLALPLFIAGVIWLQVESTKAKRPYYMPLFVAGVIWLQRFRFRVKVLLRLAGLGLAGFSIYALLPLVNGLAPHSPWSLGQSWLASLMQTKNMVMLPYDQFWVVHRLPTMAVVLYFLVPTLACLVRQRDEGTQNISRVDRFQLWIYRSLRVALLLACLWLAFDPVTGPRQIVQQQFGVSLPLLTFDYLNALGAAFLAGNLLLISQGTVQRRSRSRTSIPLRQLAAPFAAGCLVLIIVGLVARNSPAIFHMNFHPLERFGDLLADSLPAGRGVMLSSQPQKLEVFQAALAHRRNGADWLAVDTHALPTVAYRAWLERRQPAGWLTDETRHELTSLETVRLLEHIARTSRLFCLHPSYGFLFERFYLEPTGAIYEVKLRGEKTLEIPPLTAAATDANETFWTGAWQKELASLVPDSRRPPTGWQKTIQRLGFVPAPFYQDRLLAEWYSLSLDGWGAALQRQNRWSEARLRFEQALQLNTNSLSAQISLACNTNLQSGFRMGLAGVGKAADQLGSLQHLSLVLNNSGPFDEPIFCYLLGCAFQKNGMWLQAAEQFERTRTLTPGALAPELALAEIYTRLQFPDRARPLIDHLRNETKNLPASSALDLEMALLEANAWLSQTNTANASGVLQSVLQQHPDDAQIADGVISAYLAFGDFTNALQLVNAKLAKSPDDVASLNIQAAILIQSGNAAAAIPVLDHMLTLTNLPEIRLTRAIAWLACQDFAAAEADYRELEKSGVELGSVSYGLAAIAEHRHDTNQAAHYLRLCLSNAPPGTVLWHKASARLQALEPGSRANFLK